VSGILLHGRQLICLDDILVELGERPDGSSEVLAVLSS
jgi:hypothetical protein